MPPLTFESFGLSQPILTCLANLEYSEPTPIQSQAIPAALEGRDIVGLAQTGTGKTAAFALPTIARLAENIPATKQRKIRALIISPTRELAAQIHDTIKRFTTRVPLRSTIIVGGVSYHRQKHALQHGVDILVATPGRLIDMIDQKFIDLSAVETVVLDEADQMLDIGFLPAIRSILELLPEKRQTMLFSATMPKEIRKLTTNHLTNPLEISVIPETKTADRIEQKVIAIGQKAKMESISDLLLEYEGEQIIVFTRTKHGADKVTKRLGVSNIRAAAIHGNKSHNQRERALQDFRKGKTRVLVATDIAARGIDVPGVGLVVNYDLPEVPEAYVHRIGRTARAGASGIAISLVSTEELGLLGDIQRTIGVPISAFDTNGEPVELDIPRSSGAKRSFRRGGGGGGGQRRPRGSDGNHRKGGNAGGNRSRGGAKPEGRRDGGERAEGGRGDKPFSAKPRRDGQQKRSGPPNGKRRGGPAGGAGGGNRSRGPKVA
ncbi:DEAD/DEAH box helicase [Maritalea sp.]|uniref:DEAD/DEAH box helicase n=1 Tax=Maritalea sp. TaxID=2003361 RepID=UPI003EF35195